MVPIALYCNTIAKYCKILQYFGIVTSQSIAISIARSQSIVILIAKFPSIVKNVAKLSSIKKKKKKTLIFILIRYIVFHIMEITQVE